MLQLLADGDIADDPVALANRVLRHLGIENGFFLPSDEVTLQKRQFEGDGVPLRESLRPMLSELYSSQILALQDYLGEDLSTWPQ